MGILVLKNPCTYRTFMSHMYILECVDGSYYTGSTIDLTRRLWQHQNGLGAKHTAKRLPVQLVYCEFFERVSDAFYREKQVQGWSRLKKQALIANNTELLHYLSQCQNETHYRQQLQIQNDFPPS
jgi:putative endonuclease